MNWIAGLQISVGIAWIFLGIIQRNRRLSYRAGWIAGGLGVAALGSSMLAQNSPLLIWLIAVGTAFSLAALVFWSFGLFANRKTS